MVTRTVDWVIQKAYTYAKGKAVPPISGTTKYTTLVSIIDSMQKTWSIESGVDWDSLYEFRTLTATPDGTNFVPLDADIARVIKVEDEPILVNGIEYIIIAPSQIRKYRFGNYVAVVGNKLKFSHALDASLTGTAVKVPIVRQVGDLISGSSIVEVDDPMWLATASAAEFDRNDVVKAANYNLLLSVAEQFMTKMKENNGGAFEAVDTPWHPEGQSW